MTNKLGEVPGKIVGETASGLASGLTQAVVRGGKIDVVSIAVDAFGNALGNSIASKLGNVTNDALEKRREAKYQEQVKNFLASLPAAEGELTNNPQGGLRNALYILGQDDPMFIQVAAEGGHFYLPAIAGQRFLGAVDPITGRKFSIADLKEILLFSQYPDEVRVFDAKTNGVRFYSDPMVDDGHIPDEDRAGVVTEKSIHSLQGRNVKESVEFYLRVMSDFRENNAVVGVALHGLVDSLYHSKESLDLPDWETLMKSETHEAPMGHGFEGKQPRLHDLQDGEKRDACVADRF